MYTKRTCPTCNGSGWVWNIWDINNWLPFNWNIHPINRCPRCYGKGYLWFTWKEWNRRNG